LSKRKIYEQQVCSLCFNKFLNRRQLSYLIDGFVYTVPLAGIIFLAARSLKNLNLSDWKVLAILGAIQIVIGFLFAFKDGFNGYSPGKFCTDLQVLDEISGRPIPFGKSLKRNWVLVIATVPVVGTLAGLVFFIKIARQIGNGYRVGDRYAKTRVIWKKYQRLPCFRGAA